MGVAKRFLWGIGLPLVVWLLACGAGRAGEGSAETTPSGVVETEWPGVTVELTALEPGPDQTLLLRFQYVNRGADTAELAHSVYDILQRLYYVDPRTTRRYAALRAATGLATIVGTDRPGPVRLRPGQSAAFWVKVPAPPAGVERIDLHFPRTLPMQNVPVR
jgi:hypothetical protein